MTGARRSRSAASLVVVALVGSACAVALPVATAAAATQTVVVKPTADAYTTTAAPTKNTGTWKQLLGSAGKTAYLKFAVPSTPSGMQLAAAVLATSSARTQPASVTLSSVASSSWAETTITAANAPAVGASVATVTPAAGSTRLSFTLTSAVVPGTVQSFAMRAPSGTAYADARETATGPVLTLTYTPTPPPAPTSPPAPEPAPAPADTRFGATLYTGDGSTLKEAFDRETSAYGTLETVRLYYPGLPSAWPGKASVTSGPVVVSFKAAPQEVNAGLHDAYFTDWFASIPKDRLVYWTFIHEPENDIADGAFTAAEYRSAVRRLDALADKAGNPGLRTTLILMSWSLDPGARRDWRDYYPGADVVDVLGWDAYNTGGKKSPQYYESAASMMDAIVAVARTEGKPWGLGEFGSQKIAGDDGTGRAAWLKASIDYQRANGAQFVHYFDAYGGGYTLDPEYRLLDEPSKAMWRWAVSGS